MAMRFFDHQADARRRSRQLTWAFALAVLVTVVGVHLALMVPWVLMREWLGQPLAYPIAFMPVNVGVALALVLGGWWLEASSLAAGGQRLAEQLGARPAQPGSRFEEQRLVHTVQEVCIAANLPPPAVMVLPRHDGINAFASGFAPADWAVTVTDGALEHLTRTELQGLVAHECSHLAEGDTALNMRLLGMIAGLEMIWGFGDSLRPEVRSLFVRDDPLGFDGRESAVQLGALGVVGWVFGSLIMAAGYAGWLASRLLQAAVSREREFLADAQAVQWTRSADGIGGVLRKLLTQQDEAGDGHRAPRRLQRAAHLLLVADDGGWPLVDLEGRMARWLATHPPLAERIRRVYGRRRGPLALTTIDPRTGEPVQPKPSSPRTS